MQDEFETFIPLGTKQAKAGGSTSAQTILKTFGNGVKTNRDAWAYNFNASALAENIKRTIEVYNERVFRWTRSSVKTKDVDAFVEHSETRIGWRRDLKLDLVRGSTVEYQNEKIRSSLYRPFTKSNLFFDRVLNGEVYIFPSIFPSLASEAENRAICLTGQGS